MKKDFYIHLNIKGVTDEDYTHVQRTCKDLNMNNLGEYNDFYVQSDGLLVAEVLINLLCSLNYINLILGFFYTRISMASISKKALSKV